MIKLVEDLIKGYGSDITLGELLDNLKAHEEWERGGLWLVF